MTAKQSVLLPVLFNLMFYLLISFICFYFIVLLFLLLLPRMLTCRLDPSIHLFVTGASLSKR